MCPARAPPNPSRCIVAVAAAALLVLSAAGAPVAAAAGSPAATAASPAQADSPATGASPLASSVATAQAGSNGSAATGTSGSSGVPEVQGATPTDADGDGRYEDVSGDGELGQVDVVTFFRAHHREPVQEHAPYFDYTGDGSVGHGDVIRLFQASASGNRSLIVPRTPGNGTDADTPGSNATDAGSEGSLDDGERAVNDADVRTFENASAYQSYLRRSGFEAGGLEAPTGTLQPVADGGTALDATWNDAEFAADAAAPGGAADPVRDTGDGASGGSSDAPRHSETNVQVEGVAEPDIVKTDGEWVYYTGDRQSTWESADVDGTAVVDARTPTAPALNETIPDGGQLFLADDTLVSVRSDAISAYDVADPTDPSELWSRELNHTVQTARMADGTVYLVTRADSAGPRCPIRPFVGGPAEDFPAIPCTDVFRPASANGGDTTYAAMSLDPSTGEVADRVSFVGSSSNTVVYASHDGIYLTYEDSPSPAQVRLDYLEGPGSEHLDQQALDRLAELQTFGLTDRALDVEVEATIQRRLKRLPADEREQTRSAIREGFDQYVIEHKRDVVRSGIVRVDVNGTELSVDETGTVPGTVEGPFSLSARNGHLHVATTTDPSAGESVNDLYTLDGNLTVADSVTGLGVGQRIYSARYVGDRAYLVTFRQVDPFYVLNVSDPTNVSKMGKLKLPGFSDYMHPLGDHRILGVGEEDGNVKATLFNASDPTDPVVQDEVQFSDWSSVVSSTHRAFVHDEQRQRFVLPASEEAHVVSYGDGGLETVASIEPAGSPRRAVYIGDALYVFGTEELVVTNRTSWVELDRIQLGS